MPVEVSVVIPLRNEAPNVADLHQELTAVLESFGRQYRNPCDRRRKHRRDVRPPRRDPDARSAPPRDPLPSQLRPDGRICRRLRARPGPLHRDVRRRSAERSARHSRDDRARRTERRRHRRGLAEGSKGSVLQPAAPVDDRQLDHLARDRCEAARLRLFAESVSSRSREADEAVRRDAPLPAGDRQRVRRRRSRRRKSITGRGAVGNPNTGSRERCGSFSICSPSSF